MKSPRYTKKITQTNQNQPKPTTNNMDPSTFFPGRQNAMIIVQTAVHIYEFIGRLVDILTRPVYQRDFNWNERKVSNFLLTIMTSGYVQPLLLYEYQDDDEKLEGDKDSEIIDGQHRALSIQAFMTGEPIIDKKGKSIMAYLKHEGHYLFYAKHDTEDNPIKKWEDETGNKPTYFTKEQQKKFRDYKLRLETCNSRLTLERRRSLFDSLQEGVPVRNSDKDKNNMGCAVVNELNTDYPTWESDYKTNYMPLLTSCAVQNRLYCVVRLYAIFVDPTKADKFWTDKEIKDKIANNSLLARGKVGEFKEKMDQVYETMRQLKEKEGKLGAKYTPIQLFALCLGVFNGKSNLVETCASYITAKGKKQKNTAVMENKDRRNWWFDERYRGVEPDVMAYYQETRSFLESSIPNPEPAPKPSRGPRKWGDCTRKNVWHHYFGESEDGNCSFDFCGKELKQKGKWERGHNMPHSKGGSSSDINNLKVICKDCNRKQRAKTDAEFETSQMPV